MSKTVFPKDLQYYKFCLYGFFKNLRFFDAFLILFFLEKGLGFTEIGLLYAIREITIMIFEIPSGVLADGLGRRKTLAASFAVYSLSFIVFYFAQNMTIFVAAMILFAFGEAFRTGVHKAMIFHYLKKNDLTDQKVKYYGQTRSWSQMGSAVSALIAGFFVFYSGSYRIVFLISVVPYFIDTLLILSYPKYLEGEKSGIKQENIRIQMKQFFSSFLKSFQKAAMLKSVTSLSLYTGYYRAAKDYIQPLIKSMALSIPLFSYLNDDKRTAVFIGIIYFSIYLMTSLASRRAALVKNYFVNSGRAMNFTLIIGFSVGILAGIFYLFHIYVLAVVAFFLLILIENLRKPIGIAAVAEQSEDEVMATTLSVESQAKSMFAAIIALMIGWLADLLSPGLAIIIVSGVLLMGLPIYHLKK